jgi:Zn-dependent alcohol dehydrogenase
MYKSKAYSAASATSPLASTTISRRDPTDRDVQMEILFCGICHSDLHAVRNEWSEFMSTAYPALWSRRHESAKLSPDRELMILRGGGSDDPQRRL